MANLLFKDFGFKIDGASATIVDLTAHVNSGSLAGVMSLFEDTAAGDEERTYLPSLAGATVTVNGFINSTTEAVWGPLVGNRTSITKTVGFDNGVKWHTGEVLPTNVQISGSVDDGMMWSADLTFSGAVTRTSVGPA